MPCSWGPRRFRPRAAIARRPIVCTNGGWCSKRFTIRWLSWRNGADSLVHGVGHVMKPTLLEAIKTRPLLSDGAMGTQLMSAGLEQGTCGEAWNLTHPERVLAIQRAYADAGSDCIITNTFGGSRIMLARHGADEDVVAINRAAVEIARQAFGDRCGYVLGEIGPFGGLMKPYGDVPESAVCDALLEQAAAPG